MEGSPSSNTTCR